jgi:HlyD family secretion protein
MQKVAGRCIITSPGGLGEITASAAGDVDGLTLKVNDRVRQGQVIANIVRPELGQQIQHAGARVAELDARLGDIAKYGRTAGAMGRESAVSEQSNIQAQLKLADERRIALESRIGVERGLFGKGLITRQAVLDSEERLAALTLERERLRDRSKQLELELAEGERQRNRERASVSFQVSEARRALASLLETQSQTAPVTSPYQGRVIEVKVHNRSSVTYGTALAQVEREEGDAAALETELYVPAGPGKLLAAGMVVDIVPDYVKRQEEGFLRGRVVKVSDYPVSFGALKPLVRNDNLLKELYGDQAPVYARVSLDRSPSGDYVWAGAGAKPPPVLRGALCQAEVQVGAKRPWSIVLTTIRKWLGL